MAYNAMAICKSAPLSRQITTPAPHHSVFSGRMPFLLPNQQRQSTEGKQATIRYIYYMFSGWNCVNKFTYSLIPPHHNGRIIGNKGHRFPSALKPLMGPFHLSLRVFIWNSNNNHRFTAVTTCVSWHVQLRTGGFCWCKVLLPTCPHWQQPAHLD